MRYSLSPADADFFLRARMGGVEIDLDGDGRGRAAVDGTLLDVRGVVLHVDRTDAGPVLTRIELDARPAEQLSPAGAAGKE